MIKLRKKLYYLLFSVKNFGLLDGFILWLNLEVFETSTISVPGIKYEIILRKNTSDKNAFKQIFLLNEYDLFDFKNPKTVIDAGGNIGLFSILVKKKYPDSKIICIEPDEENYSILSKNLSFYSNIFNEYKGLWHKDCKLSIVKKEEIGAWGTQVIENENGSIDAISIDTIFKKYSIEYIDILKIDIETSEKYLFDNNIDWLLKSRYIIIEFHDRIEHGTSIGFFKALSKLDIKFNYFIMGDNTVIENLSFKSSND